MKTLLVLVAMVMTLVGVGLYQNYDNSTAMCEQYNASVNFTGYECPNGQTYYKQK